MLFGVIVANCRFHLRHVTRRRGSWSRMSATLTKQTSRKAVADLELLDDASRQLVASIATEDLNLRCFECGVTLGTGTFGRVFMAKHKQTVGCGEASSFFSSWTAAPGPLSRCALASVQSEA